VVSRQISWNPQWRAKSFSMEIQSAMSIRGTDTRNIGEQGKYKEGFAGKEAQKLAR